MKVVEQNFHLMLSVLKKISKTKFELLILNLDALVLEVIKRPALLFPYAHHDQEALRG